MRHIKHFKHILLILPILAVSMMILYGTPAYANTYLENTDDITVTENNSYTIINGVTEGDLTLTKSGGTTAKAHVVLVKADAKARFKAATPGYYSAGSTKTSRAAKAEAWTDSDWQVKSLTKIAAEYESAADTETGSVIAAINGDFGISSSNGVVPRGSLILEGNKEMAHSKAKEDEFFFGYKDNDVLNIVQRITSQKGDFSDAFCAPMYILRNGSLFGVDSENDSRSRTGIAYKTNGDVLLITVDEGSASSGISVKQLAKLMKASGCWNGLNLDGGGSTTMLTKRSGESLSRKTFEISDDYSDKDPETGERKISSALLLVADNSAVANNVTPANSVTTDKNTYVAGDAINVTASTNVDGSWVALQKLEDDGSYNVNSQSYFWYYAYGDNDAGTWCWENGATYDVCADGECNNRDNVTSSAGLPPGNYRVALLNYANLTNPVAGEYQSFAYKDITIEENPDAPKTYSIQTDKDVYEVGEPIMVTATAPSSDGKAWIGAVTHGQSLGSDHASFYWYYNSSTNAGISHQNGVTYNLYAQEQIGDNDYNKLSAENKALIDRTNRTLLPGTFDINVYVNDGYSVATGENGQPVTKTITIVNKHTVTFDTDGGSAVDAQTVDDGACATKPVNDPIKHGDGFDYIFTGWVTEKGGSTPFNFNTPIKGDTIIYASWMEPADYIVTFDRQDGSDPQLQSVKSGGKATEIIPSRNGYTFEGWVDKNGTPFDFNTVFDDTIGNITLYATWSVRTNSITYKDGEEVLTGLSPTTYTVEDDTFDLPTADKNGRAIKNWTDADGKVYTKIEKGTFGDLTLFAQWKRDPSLKTDKTEYVEGQAIRVTAFCDNPESWVGLYKTDEVPSETVNSFYWFSVADHADSAFNILSGESNNREGFGPGTYKIVLFDGSAGHVYDPILEPIEITIKENTEDPLTGTLKLSGYSRNDKTYSGEASSEHGRTLYEYFYGDSISVEANVSGIGAEDAWVGIIMDQKDLKTAGTTIDNHWYWTEDYKGQTVSLNYMKESSIAEGNELPPFGLNYWAVLASGSGKILAAEPFNFRTFNMDWNNVEWGESAKQKMKIELEWISKLANGENLKPSLTITRINGHFGYEKDGEGNLVEITEDVLEQGSDYNVSYPSESKDPGSYAIKVTFPSEQPDENPNYYKYLSTSTSNYGLKSGVIYYLTEEAGQHVIQYELNGGTNHDDNPDLYTTGEEVALQPPSKSGCIFEGWYTTPDFQEETLIEKISADSDQDFILYAKWASEGSAAYKIKYVLNGGTNNVKNPDGYTGAVDLAIQPAKKPGYTFDGWFFDAEFTQPADVIPKGKTGDVTLYAKFTKDDSSTVFNITTSVTGGSITANTRVKKGSSFTVSYEPNKDCVLKSITVDGVAVDISTYPSSYTFENVTQNHEIVVVYVKKVKPVVKLSAYKYIYTGKVKKPRITVTVNGKTLTTNDYSVSYNTKRYGVGKHTVKVTLKNGYEGSASTSFKILPKRSAVASAAVGKKKMTVKMTTKVWKTGGKVYQIAYKVKGTSKWKYTTTKKQSKVIYKLRKGKIYQVKVRAYKTIGKAKYYGAWSKVKYTKKIK